MMEQSPWLNTGMAFYAMAEDPVSGQIYASETDWFSFGVVHVFHPDGTEQFAFDCGVSPGVIAMELRQVNVVGSMGPYGLGNKVAGIHDMAGRQMPHLSIGTTQCTIEVLPDGQSIKRIQVQ